MDEDSFMTTKERLWRLLRRMLREGRKGTADIAKAFKNSENGTVKKGGHGFGKE